MDIFQRKVTNHNTEIGILDYENMIDFNTSEYFTGPTTITVQNVKGSKFTATIPYDGMLLIDNGGKYNTELLLNDIIISRHYYNNLIYSSIAYCQPPIWFYKLHSIPVSAGDKFEHIFYQGSSSVKNIKLIPYISNSQNSIFPTKQRSITSTVWYDTAKESRVSITSFLLAKSDRRMNYINYPVDHRLMGELSVNYNDTKKEQYLLFEVPTSGIFNVVFPRGSALTPVYIEQTIASGASSQFEKWFFYVGTGITETGELQNPKLVHYVNLYLTYGSNKTCAIPISFPVKKGDFIKIINPASTMCRNGTINTQFAISSTPITIDITDTCFSGLHVFITPNSGSSIKTGNKVFPRKGSLAKPTMVPSYKNSKIILPVMKLKTLKQASESEEIKHTFTASSDGWYFITPADRYEGYLNGNTPSTTNTDIKIYINDILVEENYPWTSPISGSRPAVEQPSTKYTVWEVSCQIEQTSCVFVRKGEVIKTTIDRSLSGFVNRSEDKMWFYMMALTYERIFVPVIVE